MISKIQGLNNLLHKRLSTNIDHSLGKHNIKDLEVLNEQ